jgi:hypothetical protein
VWNENSGIDEWLFRVYIKYSENVSEDLLFIRDLDDRIQFNKRYSESEIYYILYSVTNAACFLKSKNLQIGDVGLESILLGPKWQIKVLPTGLFPNDLDYQARHYRTEMKYIDPSIAEKIEQN